MPMNGDSVALDTDVAIAILNNVEGAWARVQEFDEIYLPVPVIGELKFGALNSGRPKENLHRIDFFLARCQLLDVRAATADVYARIRLGLKQQGRPIPPNDIWIAAVCVEQGVPLATYDGHFEHVDGLKLAGFRSQG